MCVLICSGNRIFFLFRPIFMEQDLDGASSFHPYHILLIWTTSCTTSLFVYLKLFKELASVFVVGCVCKVKEDFRNHQIFQKVFFEKFSAAVRIVAFPSKLTLSRSLAACKVRYSVQLTHGMLRLTLCHQNFISLTRFPLESGCKGTDFCGTGKHSSKLF